MINGSKKRQTLLCNGQVSSHLFGLPLGGNVLRLETWALIIQKVEKRLATWKRRMLSIAGRLTLIKALISSLPLYYMSLFPARIGVNEKINKL